MRSIRTLCAAIVLFGSISIISCTKDISTKPDATSTNELLGLGTKKVTLDTEGFTTYTVLEGQQYCVGNIYPLYSTAAMHFTVRFDSSAIYTNKIASNQYDYNKLFGFSDNNSQHQQYSARFGWRWCHNQIELSAYTYNNSVRSIVDLGGIDMNKDHDCSIIVNGDHYDFVVDGVTTTVPRASKLKKASGYKLLPYFGGDEVAPHTITIKIKETK